MGLGGVAIAVPPYVIHPKTAVLGRAGGGKTIGKGLGESGGASLKGKGGRVGFRKGRIFKPFNKFFS